MGWGVSQHLGKSQHLCLSQHLGMSQRLWVSQQLLPVGWPGAGAVLTAHSALRVWNSLPMAGLFYLCGNCSALTFVVWLLLCSHPSLIHWSVLSFLLTRYYILIYKPLKLAKVVTIIFWFKLGIYKLLKGHCACRKKCALAASPGRAHPKGEAPPMQA